MSQPPEYVRQFDFEQWSTDNPDKPQKGIELEKEFDDIKAHTDVVETNLALLQKDDGTLANETVNKDSFDITALGLMSGAWTPMGDWATATSYVVNDMVGVAGKVYVCLLAHTSGVWVDDLASGKFMFAISPSSEAWAIEAEAWAEKAEDIAVEAGKYSALHHSAKASAQRVLAETARTGSESAESSASTHAGTATTQATSATASAAAALVSEGNAGTSETAAAGSETAAELAEVNAETAETGAAADLVLTNADVVSTNADVVSTNADVVSTNADVVSTNADVVSTNADAVSTAADVVTTNADAVTTTQDAIDTAADVVSAAVSETAASGSASSATQTAADLPNPYFSAGDINNQQDETIVATDTIVYANGGDVWEVDGGSYSGKNKTLTDAVSIRGCFWKNGGEILYVADGNDHKVKQYNCLSAYNVNGLSATNSGELNCSGECTLITDAILSDDGLKCFVTDYYTRYVYQYNLTVAWSLASGSYSGTSFSCATQIAQLTGMFFANSGTRLYCADRSTNIVYQYNLTVAFDLTNCSYASKSFNTSTQITTLQDIVLGKSGLRLYSYDRVSNDIFQYDLTVAYELDSCSYSTDSLDTSSEISTCTCLAINSDGSNVYAVEADDIYQYEIGGGVKKDTVQGILDLAAATSGFAESTLVAKTANYTLLTADKGKTTVFNGTDLVCTTPAISAGTHGEVFMVQNINATALILTTVVGLVSLAENESAVLIVDNTNSEVRALASQVAGGGGVWSIKESGTFSGVANKDFTGLSKTTKIFLTNLTASAVSATGLRTSSDNGASFDTAVNDYSYCRDGLGSNSVTPNATVSETATSCYMGYIDSIGAYADSSMEITIFNPADTSAYTIFEAFCTENSDVDTVQKYHSTGMRREAAKVDAIRICPLSGTISGSYIVLELN